MSIYWHYTVFLCKYCQDYRVKLESRKTAAAVLWSDGERGDQSHCHSVEREIRIQVLQSMHFKKGNVGKEMRGAQGHFLPMTTRHALKMWRWQGEPVKATMTPV